MKRAILYARVSTSRQAELYSLPFQLEQERAYAESMGFTVAAELTDDTTGRKIERDNLTVAREMLASDQADVLVTWKLDRLHRSYINTVILRDEIQKMGKELHYAQMRMKSGTTAKQRLPEDVMALMAEIEADEIVERTQMGKREKAAKGGKWIGLNRPPYGYRAVGRGRDVTLVIDEEKAQIVRDIFNWYVYGEQATGPLSPIKIAQRLSALAIPTPGDTIEERAHLRQRPFGDWTRYMILRLLKESAYMGTYYHYRTKKIGGKTKFNTNKDEWVGVPVPAIIDKSLFDEAQGKMTKARAYSPRNAKFEYLVGRRIWCECGYKIRSTSSGSHYFTQGTFAKDYFYHRYICPAALGGNDQPRKCDMPRLEVKDVDTLVWEWVKQEIANPEVLQRRLQEIQTEQRAESGEVRDRLKKLYQHKATLEQEMKRTLTLYTRGDIPPTMLDEMIAEQNTKLKLTSSEIANTERELEIPLTDAVITDLVAFSEEFREKLETVEQTFEGKRTVIDGLDVKVVVERVNGEVMLRVSSILRPAGILLTVFGLS
jgi:site-specific DNA recombinase